MTIKHEDLLKIMIVKDCDYTDYGGVIKRWEDNNESYPDCSMGCVFYAVLEGKLGDDWGVCTNPKSPRTGLLTFEHQCGHKCFTSRKRK